MHKIITPVLLLLSLSSPLLALPISNDPKLFDLSDLLHASITNSLSIKSKQLEIRNAEMRSSNTNAALAPQVDFYASHLYRNSNTTSSATPEPWSNEAGISINENLYDNGKSWRARTNSHIEVSISKLQLLKETQSVLLKTHQYFWDYQTKRSQLVLLQEQTQTLKKQFQQIERAYLQGARSNRDFLRIKTQLQSVNIQQLNLEAEMNTSLQTLLSWLGTDKNLNLDNFDLLKTQMRSFPLTASEDLVETKIDRLLEQLENSNFDQENRKLWPELSLQASYGRIWPQYLGAQPESTSTDPQWNLQAKLLLTYRFFDWGLTTRQVQIAENSMQIQKLQRTQKIKDLALRIQNLNQQYKQMFESLLISREIEVSSEKAYQALALGYQDGKVSFLELTSAMNESYSARSQSLLILKNIILTWAEISAEQGLLDENFKLR